MRRDQIFLGSKERCGDFNFDAQVAEVFDDMIVRSVPFYHEQQDMIKETGKRFWRPGTDIYDLGCSTGTTLINLAYELEGRARLIGYDKSLAMIDKARIKVKESGLDHRIEIRYGDLNGDLAELSLENAGFVTLCWTLQFLSPPPGTT